MGDISLQGMTKKQYNTLVTEVIGLSTTSDQTRKLLLYFYKFSKTASPYVGIRPKNKYLAEHLDMKLKSLEICLYLAKKTGLLIVNGRGGQREFKFNHELLEQKMMLLLQQRTSNEPVENPVENSKKLAQKFSVGLVLNSSSFSVHLVLNKCSDAQITPVISGSNENENDNEIFKLNNENSFCLSQNLNLNKALENAIQSLSCLCDSLRSSHCEPTKVVSHDFSFSDKSNLEQMSIFDYLPNEANANTVPKGLEANAISVKLNQGDELSLFNGKVGVADVNITEGVCSAPANHGDSTHAPAKIYAVASPEPREALCTIKDECLIVSGNNTPHSASHDLTQNPPLSKSSVSGIKSGERLRKRPASTSSVPFSTPVRADNLELKKKQTRADYAEANNLLKQLQPYLGNFQITKRLVSSAKNMIEIFTSEKIFNALAAYLNAKWVTDPNIYSFLSEETLGRFATVVEKPKENPYADYPDNRLPFQKEIDEDLINDGLMPSYMNKELAMKYDIYDLLYDENGNPHRYRDPHTPEHDQWLIDHVHERPSLLDYYDPEYKTIIHAPGSPEYEKRKRQIDKKNAHIAELRKIVGLEV
jgi:hypothetical protein|nr:MAG TPA: hypothetical protein [Caudoviricetes sp.]